MDDQVTRYAVPAGLDRPLLRAMRESLDGLLTAVEDVQDSPAPRLTAPLIMAVTRTLEGVATTVESASPEVAQQIRKAAVPAWGGVFDAYEAVWSVIDMVAVFSPTDPSLAAVDAEIEAGDGEHGIGVDL